MAKPVHFRRRRGALCGDSKPHRLAKYPKKVTCRRCLAILWHELSPGVVDLLGHAIAQASAGRIKYVDSSTKPPTIH